MRATPREAFHAILYREYRRMLFGVGDDSRAIRGRAYVSQDPFARGVADLPQAGVLAFELFVTVAKRTHDAVGEIVPAILAGRIAARHFEHRRRVCDDDATNVRDLGRDDAGATLFEIETETVELGTLGLETGSFVFATAPLGETIRRVPVASVHQDGTFMRIGMRDALFIGSAVIDSHRHRRRDHRRRDRRRHPHDRRHHHHHHRRRRHRRHLCVLRLR